MRSEQVSSKDKQPFEPLAYGLGGASVASSLSKRTLANAIRAGDLVSYKRGRRRIIFKHDLENYLRGVGTRKSLEAPRRQPTLPRA